MAEIKVIIAGAGIAGLATAIALRQLNDAADDDDADHPKLKLDIQLYEKATELKEIGASIALSPNGLRTLERLGVYNALDDHVAYRGPSGLPMIYRHWKTNEVVSVDRFVDVPDRRHQTARFHRAHLHEALLAHVPRETIHLDKAVQSAQADLNNGGAVTVFFKDGSSVQGDILIGADGLRSKVRAAFTPEHTLHWTGRTLFRSTFDAALVEGIPDLPPDSTHWWGPKHTFFASRLGKSLYTTVGSFDPHAAGFGDSSGDPAKVQWDQEGDVAVFRELYKDWNPVVKALTEATPYVRLYPNFAGEPLDTWVFGSRVTLVGDAAHTHGGAHAAGGSLALDDAWALYLAFRHVLLAGAAAPGRGGTSLNIQDIHRALTLYERTRRPHTERLVTSVLAAAKAPGAPETDKALRQKMQSRPSTTWLTEHDVEATFARVLAEEGQDHSYLQDNTTITDVPAKTTPVREHSRL